MQWKLEVVFYAVTLLIVREIFSIIKWFIKKDDDRLSDLAFKITKEKQEHWRYGIHEFQFIPYFFMVKNLLKSKAGKSDFHYIDWLMKRADKLDGLIADYERERKKHNEAYDKFERMRDDIREAYSKLGELERKETEGFKKDHTLWKLIWGDIKFKLRSQKGKKINEMAEKLNGISEKIGNKNWREFQEEQEIKKKIEEEAKRKISDGT